MIKSASDGSPLELLLKAAQYIENQQDNKQHRDPDHVYAQSPSSYRVSNQNHVLSRPRKSTRRMQNRSSHNELEKNRRAHLRGCLDSLKTIVPLNRDSTRHTTLGLLNQASDLIKSLERRHEYYRSEQVRLKNRNELLKTRLQQLEASRHRRDSTGSSWSSGRSESSNDSDKDDELVIDVANECGDVINAGDQQQQQAMVVDRNVGAVAINNNNRYETVTAVNSGIQTVVATTNVSVSTAVTLSTGCGGVHLQANRPSKLITINVSKPLTIPLRCSQFSMSKKAQLSS